MGDVKRRNKSIPKRDDNIKSENTKSLPEKEYVYVICGTLFVVFKNFMDIYMKLKSVFNIYFVHFF